MPNAEQADVTVVAQDTGGSADAPPLAGRLGVTPIPVGVSLALVATSSFSTLVLELVAGRLLAPAVGVSLYSWTEIGRAHV